MNNTTLIDGCTAVLLLVQIKDVSVAFDGAIVAVSAASASQLCEAYCLRIQSHAGDWLYHGNSYGCCFRAICSSNGNYSRSYFNRSHNTVALTVATVVSLLSKSLFLLRHWSALLSL